MVPWLMLSVSTLLAEDPIKPRLQFQKQYQNLLELGKAGSFDETHAKYPCVLRVGEQWRMWYNGRAADCFTGQVGLAISDDGFNWKKANQGQPVMGHGPPGSFDETKVDHPTVVYFDNKFHMWYTGGPQSGPYTIGYATSRDGLKWQRQNDGKAVLGLGAKGKFDQHGVLHPTALQDEKGLLHLWYNGVDRSSGFRLGYATSRNGIDWQRMNAGNPVLVPSVINDQAEEYVYNAFVLRDGGRYHMWYSSAQGIRQNSYQTNGSGIVYCASKDGIHWTKDDKTTLFNGPRGSLDEYSCFAPCVVRRDDALFMYYSTGYLVKAKDPRRFRTSLAIHYFDKQRSALPTYRDHQDLQYYLDHLGKRIPVRTQHDWMIRRHHVLGNMQRVMGPYAALQDSRSLDTKVIEEKELGNLVRRKLTYRSDRQERVTAYLFLPAERSKPSPAVLCLQQTNRQGKEEVAGIGGDPNLAYALHLAQRGYVTLAPDYPSFGDSRFDFDPMRGYLSGTMKAIFDNIRAVDLLQSLAEVDGNRIGVIGHSLGGHNAIFTAAFEPRLKVIVSNCGFCRFHKDDVPSWTSPKYMPRLATVYGNDPNRIPFDFPEIIATFAPRPFLAIAAQGDTDFDYTGVQDSIKSAGPIYELLGAAAHLQAHYPKTKHAFLPAARTVAYQFLDKYLKE
jgi:dienelactone hydrolase/predicted GH43/DUF377 family glycosyl hydrolase